MKQFQTIVNTVLACALTFFLIVTGLPNVQARAATATPPPSIAEAASTPVPSGVAGSACDPNRAIHVSGTAVVNVKPDRALIKLGVQSNGRSAKEAQAKNSATINQVTKALKTLGIEAKDIATDWYFVEPLYEDYDSLHIKGYRIYNIIEITVRDVDKANDAIVAAFQAGANQVVDVEFYTSELRKYRDQAREMAMTAASEKAKALAQTAGADTSCVLNINESSSSHFNGWGWWWWGYGNNQNQWTQNAVQNVAPTGGETPSMDDGPVSAGMISIRAEVTATFGLK
ncbi:MAG: SIMPL domain-containing protein [Chloroflexota bacterium]